MNVNTALSNKTGYKQVSYLFPTWLTVFNSVTLYIIEGSKDTFSINIGELVIF